MLILTRAENERIIIGDPNKPIGVITVVKVRNDGRVRIGLEFPIDIGVHREEVARLIQAEQSASHTVNPALDT